MPNSIPLSRLSAGDRAVVVSVEADQDLQGRLMGLGLFAGSELEVLYGGIGKSGPMRIGVGHTRIAIGREICEHIKVSF